MVYVLYGNDRARIAERVNEILGEGYEVFEGENLEIADLMNIFQGSSLFASERKILIKDLTPARGSNTAEAEKTERQDFYEAMTQYVNTPHTIVIWETTVSQKKTFKDFIALPNVKAQKIDQAPKADARKVFDVYDTALNNGERAVKMLREIKDENDPYMFFGLMASQALKKYSYRQGDRERQALKELAKLDMQMKTTAIEPWLLIESFLLRLSSLQPS